MTQQSSTSFQPTEVKNLGQNVFTFGACQVPLLLALTMYFDKFTLHFS